MSNDDIKQLKLKVNVAIEQSYLCEIQQLELIVQWKPLSTNEDYQMGVTQITDLSRKLDETFGYHA